MSEPRHEERKETPREAYRADARLREDEREHLAILQKNMRATEDFLQALNNRFNALERRFARLDGMMGEGPAEKGQAAAAPTDTETEQDDE